MAARKPRRPPLLSSAIAPWLLDAGYLALLGACSPLLVPKMSAPRYREGLAQRLLGAVPERRGDRPCLWIHGVSLGEILAARQLIPALVRLLPGWELVISATTLTGVQAARQRFGEHTVVYSPLDLSPIVERAFRRLRPDALVLIELDLWPNWLLAAARRKLPVALVNGRMSPRSFAGYRRARPLMRQLLAAFGLLLVQEQSYAERFVQLGADPARVEVTGNIKLDQLPEPDPAAAEAARAITGFRPEHRVLLGGSTSGDEERHLIAAYAALREEHPELRLALCPRHPERGDEVAGWIEAAGLPLARRSQQPPPNAEAVWLFDTIGELGGLYQLADVPFVGGSLNRRGGQNMLEPAALGKPPVVGPNTWNFADAVAELLAADGIRQLAGPEELLPVLRELLADPMAAKAIGARARGAVGARRGASQRSAERIAELLIGR